MLWLANVLEDVGTEHNVEWPRRSDLIRDALVKVSPDEVVHALPHAINLNHVDCRHVVSESVDAFGQQPT